MSAPARSGPPSIDQRRSTSWMRYAQFRRRRALGKVTSPRNCPPTRTVSRSPARDTGSPPTGSGARAVAMTVVGRSASSERRGQRAGDPHGDGLRLLPVQQQRRVPEPRRRLRRQAPGASCRSSGRRPPARAHRRRRRRARPRRARERRAYVACASTVSSRSPAQDRSSCCRRPPSPVSTYAPAPARGVHTQSRWSWFTRKRTIFSTSKLSQARPAARPPCAGTGPGRAATSGRSEPVPTKRVDEHKALTYHPRRLAKARAQDVIRKVV